jgi:hypothetical protein
VLIIFLMAFKKPSIVNNAKLLFVALYKANNVLIRGWAG